MYLLFITIPLMLIAIGCIVYIIHEYIKYDYLPEAGFGICAFCIVITIFLSGIFYGIGYDKSYISDKTYRMIELYNYHLRYDTEPHESVIKLANDINCEIDKYNNLWFRFDIEDRSKDKIDINTYLGKFKKGE